MLAHAGGPTQDESNAPDFTGEVVDEARQMSPDVDVVIAGHSHSQVDGRYALAYDPRIADVFKASPAQDVDLWAVWDKVACPTLLLRGAVSDILPHEVAQQMTQRGPKAKLVEFPNIGHAPMLMADEQVRVVREFLLP